MLQVMALLKAAGGEQEEDSWEQAELAETLWAEMGLQPDAHITQVSHSVAMSRHVCRICTAALTA